MRYPIRSHYSVRRRPGLTLAEILVVIAIIGVLATLSFYVFNSVKLFGNKVETDTQDAMTSFKKFDTSKLKYPTGNNPKTVASTPANSANASNNSGTSNTSNGGTVAVPSFDSFLAQARVSASPPAAPPAVVDEPPPPRPEWIPGMYYVAFKASVTDPTGTAQRLARVVRGEVLDVYTNVIYGFGLTCSDAKIAMIKSDPAIESVEQARYIYPCVAPLNIQRMFSNGFQGSTQATPATAVFHGVPTNIYRFTRNTSVKNIVTTRLIISGSNAQSAVAILDTGIDSGHPDLSVVAALDFTGGGNPQDTHGHGTHIAGVVGASDQSAGAGVVGVYPGAPLINLKVMGAPIANETIPGGLGAGSSLFVYSALSSYVIPNAQFIRVCLMPFQTAGVDGNMNALVNAAGNAGVLMVAPCGNDGGALNSPATATQAIVVGAMRDRSGASGGTPVNSGGGDESLHPNNNGAAAQLNFCAPGGDTPDPIFFPATPFYFIRSTVPTATGVLYSSNINNGGTGAMGTSFAAAHVAGMLALVTDPQTSAGFVVGNRVVTTFAPLMTNKAGAIAGLTQLTHQTASFQMIAPSTAVAPNTPGSAWKVSNGIPRVITPYMKQLYNDRIGGVPVPNLYVNPLQAPTNLTAFPG